MRSVSILLHESTSQAGRYCHMRKAIRQFVPGRIRAIKLTDDTFTRDETFDVNKYLSGSMAVFRGDGNPRHTVRLRFTGTAVDLSRERCGTRVSSSRRLRTAPWS